MKATISSVLALWAITAVLAAPVDVRSADASSGLLNGEEVPEKRSGGPWPNNGFHIITKDEEAPEKRSGGPWPNNGFHIITKDEEAPEKRSGGPWPNNGFHIIIKDEEAPEKRAASPGTATWSLGKYLIVPEEAVSDDA